MRLGLRTQALNVRSLHSRAQNACGPAETGGFVGWARGAVLTSKDGGVALAVPTDVRECDAEFPVQYEVLGRL